MLGQRESGAYKQSIANPQQIASDAATTQTYLLGLAPTDPLPRLLIFMTKRDLIRWFIKEVHWATPRNVAYFMEGIGSSAVSRVYSSELCEMQKVKDRTFRLKRIRNQDGHFAYTMLAKTLPTFLFNHNVCVRNIIGKFLHDRGMQEVSFEKPADASIRQYRFELDNGHMSESQLEEKLVKNYSRLNVQIIFIMRHRECPHLEAERLKKVFQISSKVFPHQPNKVLGACYTSYLENGTVFNRKGQAKIKPFNH